MIEKETDLAKPVADWLRLQGYTVYSEIPYWDRCIDMVGLKDSEICIVELKLRYCKNGVIQASKTQGATDRVYLAVSNKPKNKSIEYCKKVGIGLLNVNSIIQVLLEPRKVRNSWQVMSNHLRENCIEPSDDAGKQCMSGCGPAQAIGVLVKDYVKNNPKASWKEIFENIPNHYSNYKSLSCAMNGYLGISLMDLKRLNRC